MNATIATAKYLTEARPYARAVFKFAKENQVLSQWEQWLIDLTQVILDQNMQFFLGNPKLMANQKAQFVIEILKSLLGKIEPTQENFIYLLAQNNRFNLLSSICFLYQTYLAEDKKTMSIEIRTAFLIDPDQKIRLEKALEKKYQCKINFNYEEDRSLLGGALIRIGDEVIDSSVRHKLTQLKSVLLED